MTYEQLLSRLSSEIETGGLEHLHRLPAASAGVQSIQPELPGKLTAALTRLGIPSLWTHQARAIDAIRRGENVIVSTPTASGKSLCFNIPVIEKILTGRSAKALYLYPTKALAQDQLRAIRDFAIPQVSAATYDGDTPSDERPSVRRYANIVLSNPDMAHFGILPNHSQWANFLSHLELIVLDEVHTLKGIFGSHVGAILRRLRRIARHYGSEPSFVATSATIANPGNLAQMLTGEDFTEVTRSGSPGGEKLFAFWNPPFVDEAAGIRGSSNWEAARLLAGFANEGIRTIAFSKSRAAAELVAGYAKQMTATPELAAAIRPYRAGYLASDRREIERQLFSGELIGVSATTALELGVDIGGLDAVVMNGFPGTVSGMWQQAGRAGRSIETSVAVLIGHDDPLDQYYISHPEILMGKPHDDLLIDVTNPNILKPHLGSAAYELPIPVNEVDDSFGAGASQTADQLIAEGSLVARAFRGDKRLHWRRRRPPGLEIDLRSLGGEPFSIVEEETGVLLGTVDASRAFHQIYPGAIHIHQGENYLVTELRLDESVAMVEPTKANYYTESRDVSDISVVAVVDSKKVNSTDFFVGRVSVIEVVVGFVRKALQTGEVIGFKELELPPARLDTYAFWYTTTSELLERAEIDEAELPGSLHAAEHAAIGLLPAFAMADRWDIGGVSTAHSADTGAPTVFIYDGYPGGVGIAQRGFDQAAEHLAATADAVRECGCDDGCPSCVQSPKCGNGNEPLDKAGAIRLLGRILMS